MPVPLLAVSIPLVAPPHCVNTLALTWDVCAFHGLLCNIL